MKGSEELENYHLLRASDVVNDGMWLELYEGEDHTRQVAGVFFSDQDGSFTFHCYRRVLPLEVLEYLSREARRWLPPVAESEGG